MVIITENHDGEMAPHDTRTTRGGGPVQPTARLDPAGLKLSKKSKPSGLEFFSLTNSFDHFQPIFFPSSSARLRWVRVRVSDFISVDLDGGVCSLCWLVGHKKFPAPPNLQRSNGVL